MNPTTLGILASAFLLATAAGVIPARAAEPLRIVAATTDLGAIARAVTGDDATIEVVARPDRDLHSLEVRPSTMRLASKADFYLEVGLMLLKLLFSMLAPFHFLHSASDNIQ